MSAKKTQSLGRVIEIAAQMFAKRRFEDVSVNDVAVAAHCSTATIYEIYETKENLFLNAIDYYIHRWTPPRPRDVADQAAFQELLTYAEARIRFLAHPTTRGITRALGERYEKAHHFVRRSIEDQATFEAVSKLIEACMDGGLMRPGEAESTTYSVMAGISFEPIAAGAMYGVDAPIAVAAILRKAFTPHVTQAGARRLREFLQREAMEADAAGEPFLPLSLAQAESD